MIRKETRSRKSAEDLLVRAGKAVAYGTFAVALAAGLPCLAADVFAHVDPALASEASSSTNEGRKYTEYRVVGHDALGRERALEDGGVYAEGFDLCLPLAFDVDDEKSALELTGVRPGMVRRIVGTLYFDDEGARLHFAVAEGTYQSVVVHLVERSSTQATRISFENVSVDATAPALDARVDDEPLEDGAVLDGSGRLELSYYDAHPVVLEDGSPSVTVSVRNLVNNIEVELAPWEERQEDLRTVWIAKAPALDDGTYAVRMEAVDCAGNVSETFERTFVLDGTAPSVACDYDRDAVRFAEEESRYFDRPLKVRVGVVDRTLNTKASEVLGVPMASWLAGEADVFGVTCDTWEHHEREDGQHEYLLTLTLGDGAYFCDELVCAQDETGHEASWPHETEPGKGGRLVVDTDPPKVRATVDAAPVYLSADGELVVLGASANVRLACEDDSGLRSAELVGASEGQDLKADVASGVVTLETHGLPLTRDVTMLITDKAGNATTWSLAPEGTSRTAQGTSVVSHAPLEVAQTGASVASGGHPRVLAWDTSAPVLSIDGIGEGAYLSANATASVSVEEQTLGYLARYEPGRALYALERNGTTIERGTISYEDAGAGDQSHVYPISIPVRQGHEDDGDYVLRASLVDLAGNESTEVVRTFAVDTVSPVLRVTFDDEGIRDERLGAAFYQGTFVAHITLAERSFFADELNSETPPVVVGVRASDGGDASSAVVSSWRQDADGGFSCDVSFVQDGTYELVVTGADHAGNPLVGDANTPVDADGHYASGLLVRDATGPEVTIAYAPSAPSPQSFGGTDYFDAPVPLVVTVRDRNMDDTASTVSDSAGMAIVPRWEVTGEDGSGVTTHAATMWYREESTGSGAGVKRPVVHVRDLAGNEQETQVPTFVVDQTAPTVRQARMSKRPSAVGTSERGEPIWFYNEQDGAAPVLEISFLDEYPVADVWVDDPDGTYTTHVAGPVGERFGTLTIPLRDFEQEGNGRDTVFDEDVRVCVRDVSGNVRTWSLAPTGTVNADRQASNANAVVDDVTRRPAALVKDATSPVLELFGIDEGDYLNTEQVAHLSVHDHGIPTLRSLDASRVVAHVQKTEARSGGEVSSWDLTVGRLEGEGDDWHIDQDLSADGHYVLNAQLTDYAGNGSNVVRTQEFTVDRTPPTLAVTWDNNDVRNSMYYCASRTATVTVTEHNFDESRIVIETTGVVSAWTHEGDVHECKVTFNTNAPASNPHTLKVSGTDLAGNVVASFTEPPFAIDTQAPTVEFLRRTSTEDRFVADGEELELLDASAFSQAVTPVVACADDASFDARGVNVQLQGKRGSESPAIGSHEVRETTGANGMRVSWGNLGLEERGEELEYLMEADDVYTLTAQVTDLAGNVSSPKSVTFSVNRYGSNFFVEPMSEQMDGDQGAGPLLFEAPHIVVHEVNVSGDASEAGESRVVTKEYAHATSAIERTDGSEGVGYVLVQSTEASELNPYDGWTETQYKILPGNFGEGSSSDHGDGGQGSYRVDISSVDRAQNNNTTAWFWESGESREGNPQAKGATVAFELDERGPSIEDLQSPSAVSCGGSFAATFRLKDEVTQGDFLEVLVDGEPVAVRREGSAEDIAPTDAILQQGVFTFDVNPAPLWASRSIEVRVHDYTGLDSRTDSYVVEGFKRTTLVTELGIGAFAAVLAVVAWRVARSKRLVP